MLLGLDEDHDGHVSDEDGARLLDDVDELRHVEELKDQMKQREARGRPTKEDREPGFRSSSGDEQQTHDQITPCTKTIQEG